MKPLFMLIFVILLACPCAHAAGLGFDFNGSNPPPYVTPIGDAKIAQGVLQSRSQPGWRRSGAEIGPLPVAAGGWTVAYDFRPVSLGSQTSEFVSMAPSTHWYMCYLGSDGRFRLHTKRADGWQLRTTATRPLEPGKWYHATVTLMPTTIRFVVGERGSSEVLWDSGEVAMEDIGKQTTCALADEAPDDKGQTEWDNVALQADNAQAQVELEKLARQVEAQRARKAQMAKSCEALKAAGIAIIPTPQQVTLLPGTLKVAALTITAGKAKSEAATVVQQVLQERLPALPVKIGAGGNLKLTQWTQQTPPPWRGDQGYQLNVTGKGVELLSQTPAGFFYGAQTLCQLLQGGGLRQCRITDWPDIPNRLVMVAVSQGAFQVIDTGYWKRLIRELAALKINYIMPYDEGGAFTYEKFPFLGIKGEHGQDGFTQEKGRLLSAYARAHFMQIVPQSESLGHAGNFLTHEEMKDLRENGGVFCSTNPKVFDFFADQFDELVRMFPDSRYIHVGGDEFGSGFAKCPVCKARAEEIGKPALYAEHMMKLHQLLQARHRQMMIWWHEEGFTDAAADKLAKDIVIFDWHYGNQSSYPTLQKLQDEGFRETWATPAVTRYYDATNDWDNTFGNISGFMLAAADRRVPGECTCTWVHGIWGGRNMFECNLYGVAFSGQCAWNSLACDYGDFRWRFARQWLGVPATVAPETLDQEMLQAVHAPYGSTKEQKFWNSNRVEEEMLAAPLRKTAEDIQKQPQLASQASDLLVFCQRASENLSRLNQQATRNQVSLKYFSHDVRIMRTTAQRILLTRQLLDAYEQAKRLPAAQAQAKLQPVIAGLTALVGEYKAIEQGFNDSILEAGGGRCGSGGWYPYIASGGIIFRAPQGRAEVEKEIAYLQQALQTGQLPAEAFPK